jgi:hypothetical protein
MSNITIQLDATAEQKLREKARLRGQTLEGYLQQLAEDDAQTANGAATPPTPQTTEAEATARWIQAWQAWAANHPSVPVAVDDSRESIYEGRGE